MKTTESVKAVLVAVTILSLVGTMFGGTILAYTSEDKYVSENKIVLKDSELEINPIVFYKNVSIEKKLLELKIETEEKQKIEIAEAKLKTTEEPKNEEPKAQIVYDNMSLDELANKLDRSLNGEISGQGNTFATMAIELGIDPYLSVAIVLHETGCKWNCSTLLKYCNNVGGMKAGGNTKCNGGSYTSFVTLEEGIKAYMNNLYKNYISQGLTTAYTIGPKYAASKTWANQVNTYIESIKAT